MTEKNKILMKLLRAEEARLRFEISSVEGYSPSVVILGNELNYVHDMMHMIQCRGAELKAES